MREETGAGNCPECGTPGAQPGQLICQGCFVPFSLMKPARDDISDPDPTEALPQVGPEVEHTRVIAVLSGTAKTRRDTPARALRLRFPGGEIVPVEPGYRLRLGRDPQMCPAVNFLAVHDNLSRIHATVRVESDGSAWIVDEGSTNGTFAHGYRLTAGTEAPLRPGDTIRLAADVTVQVLT
ncbi:MULTISPECIES: FHA domain-containing protein [unclassified Streptomyces]|uniref:FHA domain-containing protein n=1 Tax=unclassified Streptomyces TaxID=2593676 RepID=UPI002E2A4EFC|nr:FHA domain-containing protein [Streptomyces sp. NBC_00223]